MRRCDLVARLAERVRRTRPAGDLVDMVAGCTARQDIEWACEAWARANR